MQESGENPMERIFVYGSLAPGRENEHLLAKLVGTWQAASVRGEMDPLGWGTTGGYPGLYLDPEGSEVVGFLFASEALSAHWSTLDHFEGEAYTRVMTSVRCQDGSMVSAYVYVVSSAVRQV